MLLKAPARAARVQHQPADNSLRFDRRRQRRSNTCGRIVATFTDSTGSTHLTWMDALDTSDAGLGLRSPIPVPPGAIVSFHPTVSFHRSVRKLGMRVSADAAMAVSCEQDGTNAAYRIGCRVSRCSAA